MYQEIARWSCLGQGEVERTIASHLKDSNTMHVAGSVVMQWMQQKEENKIEPSF